MRGGGRGGREELETLRLAGDAIFTDSATIGALLRKGVASTYSRLR